MAGSYLDFFAKNGEENQCQFVKSLTFFEELFENLHFSALIFEENERCYIFDAPTLPV